LRKQQSETYQQPVQESWVIKRDDARYNKAVTEPSSLDQKGAAALACFELQNTASTNIDSARSPPKKKAQDYFTELDQKLASTGFEKTENYLKLEATSKSLTRKAIGLDKFKANLSNLRS
jgi:hypothetical protein